MTTRPVSLTSLAKACVVAAACLVGGPDAEAAPGPGPVRVDLSPQTGSVEVRRARTVSLSEHTSDRKAVPKGIRDGRFGLVEIAPAYEVALAIDVAPGFERVWMDTDRDGSLTDETPVTWTRRDLRFGAAFTVRVRPPGAQRTVPVGVKIHRGMFSPDDVVRVRVGTHAWGAALFAGELRLFAVEDGNGNFAFDDPEDRIYVDLDGDGEIDGRPGSRERVRPGAYFRIGDGRWTARSPRADGSVLVVSPPPRPPEAPRAPGGFRFPVETDAFARLARTDSEARRDRLGHIAAIGTREAFRYLHDTARAEQDLVVRMHCVGLMGSPWFRSVDQGELRMWATGADRGAAIVALGGLAAMGHPGRGEIFTGLLRSQRRSVAREAARLLAHETTDAARTALATAICSADSPHARLAVFQGARDGPEPLSGKVLHCAARDRLPELRALAVEELTVKSLSAVRKIALAEIRAGLRSEVATPVLVALSGIGDEESVDAVLSAALEPRLRERALDALVSAGGPRAVSRLVEWLAHPDREMRLLACEALADLRSPRAAKALTDRLLVEDDREVRTALLDAAGEQGDSRALHALTTLTREGDPEAVQFAFRALGRPEFAREREITELLDRALRGKRWRNQIHAVRAVVRSGNATLLPGVYEALKSDHRRVRLAAAEALGELRRPVSVGVLVARIADEGSTNVREAIGRSLFRLTGVNLYDDEALWTAWWEENGDRFTMPQVPPEFPKQDVAGTRAAPMPKFYGIPIEGQSVVFVIDRSGSMDMFGMAGLSARGPRGEPSKFQTASRELLQAVESMDDGDRVNVIFFEDHVHSWSSQLRRLSNPVRKSLRKHVEKQVPQGATNLYDALERALKTKRVETVVLLSDGMPNRGRFTEEQEIVRQAAKLNRERGITIHCVSIGQDSTLLRRLAASHGGEYVRR